MRRIIFTAVIALVVGGAAWVLWPATTWPRAFCTPVVRVVGADVDTIAAYMSHNEPVAITPAEHKMVVTLRADIVLARAAAPTRQLRTELNLYHSRLSNDPSMNIVTDAMSQFDQKARTQLEACGVRPSGHSSAAL